MALIGQGSKPTNKNLQFQFVDCTVPIAINGLERLEPPLIERCGGNDGLCIHHRCGAFAVAPDPAVVVQGAVVQRERRVDVGKGEGNELSIVTNAPNVSEGVRVVVATVGAKVGGDDEMTVAKRSVGGAAGRALAAVLVRVGGGRQWSLHR